MEALAFLGFLALVVGIIMLIVNAIRRKGMRTWAIVLTAGLVVLVVGASLSQPSPTVTPTPSPVSTEESQEGSEATSDPATTPGQSESAIQVAATDLDQAYWDNKVAADQQYKGKLLEVSGVVLFIDHQYISLEGTTFVSPVTCYLRRGQESQLARLVAGQWTTVRGVCAGSGLLGVRLNDCVLISSTTGPTPSPEVVVTYSTRTATQIGPYNTARSGYLYLIVDLDIENRGYASFSTSSWNFYVIVNRVQYDTDWVHIEDWLETVSLLDGGKTSGKIVFQVPQAVASLGYELVYEAIWQEYNIRWSRE